ncbi:hypothetical protein AAG906_005618 [Vitis piasezkii]
MKRLKEENEAGLNVRNRPFLNLTHSKSTNNLKNNSCQTQPDKGTNSTWALRKRRCGKRSHLFNAMRAQLGPQEPGMEGQPCMLETLRARLGSPTATTMS